MRRLDEKVRTPQRGVATSAFLSIGFFEVLPAVISELEVTEHREHCQPAAASPPFF